MDIRLNHVMPIPLADGVSRTAIWNQDFIFNSSQSYLVSAESGRGKSTLIGILTGIRHDYSGELFIGNKNAKAMSESEWAAHRSVYCAAVYQDLRLFSTLTGMENVQLAPPNSAIVPKELIHEFAIRLEVEPCLYKKTGQCSFGQQQRLALIRALARPFQWLFLDEPFSHLDLRNRKNAAELIKQVVEQQQAGLLVTSLGGESGWEELENVEV